MLLAYLLDPSNTAPEGVARRYGGEWTEEAGERALLSERLYAALLERLKGEERLLWLYEEVEKPLSRVLAHMEATGVWLDVAYLKALSLEVEAELRRLEEEVHRLAGHPFNLNSRDQLERVLFDELGLPAIGKTEKTGKRSTSAAVLEALREAHPIVDRILQYRELSKLKGTYIDPLPALVHPKTNRLHTRFNQTATATGRLSSSDPNLQNIPVRTPLGQRIRRAFVAEEGWRLVVLDYSQIELRVLAHLSGDENLIRVFQEGQDIHTQTASWMFGVPPEAVDSLMRRAAKTINFGVLYGMSAHRLSGELAIPYEEAVAFIERYFQSYPKVRAWIEKTLAEGRERGYVETLFGRRRYVPDLASRVKSIREAAERMAFNMPVQGTAADLMKLAMVKLFPRLQELGARMLLQVHDELVLEAPKEQAEEVAQEAKRTMEEVWPLKVPLEVEVGIGEDWLSAKA